MKPFDDWANEYLRSERAVAQAQADRMSLALVRDMGPVELARRVYDDKLSELRGPHAYSETGSIHTSVLLHRSTVKELFPVSHPEATVSLMGVDLVTLQWLVEQRLVLLLIQHPEHYRHLPFLHPLLQASFQPACYELRDRIIYQKLTQDEYQSLVRRGLRHPVLGRDRPFPLSLRESYERYIEGSNVRWRQRNAQRYAALAAVVGAEALDEALGVPSGADIAPGALHAVQSRFFYLHRYLLHPLTQGLGGVPFAVATSADSVDSLARSAMLGEEVQKQLMRTVTLNLPATSSISLIERIQGTSIPDDFGRIEARVLEASRTGESLSGTHVASDVSATIRHLDEQSRSLERSVARRLQTSLRFVGFGSALALARQHPEISTFLAGTTPTAAKVTSTAVVDAFHRVFRRNYLPWQFWRLRRTLEEAKG